MADETEEVAPDETEQQVDSTSEPSIDDAVKALEAKLAEETALRETAEASARASAETAATERQAKQELETYARGQQQAAVHYQNEARSHEAQVYATAIDAATSEIEANKRQYRVAMESQDYEVAADAQAKISSYAAQLFRLQEAAEYLKLQPQQQQQRPVSGRVVEQQQPQQPQQQVSPADRFLSGFSSAAQAWIRQHSDQVVTGAKGYSLSPKALSAHYAAVSEGVQPDTKEYFDYLNQQLYTQAADEDDSEPVIAPRRTAVAAPVSRGSVAPSGKPADRITLTRDEVEAARIAGMDAKTYAANKRALDRENPNWRMSNRRH